MQLTKIDPAIDMQVEVYDDIHTKKIRYTDKKGRLHKPDGWALVEYYRNGIVKYRERRIHGRYHIPSKGHIVERFSATGNMLAYVSTTQISDMEKVKEMDTPTLEAYINRLLHKSAEHFDTVAMQRVFEI